MKKLVITVVGIFFLIIVGGILFIKLNTSAAADFTDNVLRPLLGANTVIFMEKIFFNASDKVKQITVNSNDIQAPQFIGGTMSGQFNNSGLELNTIQSITDFSRLRNEGVWTVMRLDAFPNEEVMAHTFVRPDPARSYAIVTIAQMDMSKFRLGTVAGIKEPGGKLGNPGPGKVPQEIIDSNKLVAAFDGGFQFRDGEYGMIVDGKTYLPLKNDLGTVVGYKNGDIKIIDYKGQDLGSNVAFVRQNCPILVENGQVATLNVYNKKLWGRTMTTAIYTWRTGMGITKKGNLLFAVGNSLTPTTLATALKMAGAVNAIQLDINPNWVRFNLFNPIGNGQYTSTTLTRDLKNGAQAYLTGYSKDFFYLYKR